MKWVSSVGSECMTHTWAIKIKGTWSVVRFLQEDARVERELACWLKCRPQRQADLYLNPVLTGWVILNKLLNLSVRQFVACELGLRIVMRIHWARTHTHWEQQLAHTPALWGAPRDCGPVLCGSPGAKLLTECWCVHRLISFPHHPGRSSSSF